MLQALEQMQWYEWQIATGFALMVLGGAAETTLWLRLNKALRLRPELRFLIRGLAYGILAFVVGVVLILLAVIQNPGLNL